MLNCTNHFLERWTERIVEITTEPEMKAYIVENREIIIEHANKTFDYAEFIYKGQIGDNITRNYFVKDELVFVTNTDNNAFITIYKVDMGLPSELNLHVVKELIKTIHKLHEEKDDIELQALMEIDDKKHQSEQIGEQIKIMEEQIANMKKEKKFIDDEVKALQSKSLNTGLELRRYTLMLVNSKEYKADLLRINK